MPRTRYALLFLILKAGLTNGYRKRHKNNNENLNYIGDFNVISRIWHGWTKPENADAYETLLKNEIFPGINNRRIAGYRGIHLLRRNLENEVEFITIMWFDSIEAVRSFAGEDYEIAVIPAKARTLLSRFDPRSRHYEVKAEMQI